MWQNFKSSRPSEWSLMKINDQIIPNKYLGKMTYLGLNQNHEFVEFPLGFLIHTEYLNLSKDLESQIQWFDYSKISDEFERYLVNFDYLTNNIIKFKALILNYSDHFEFQIEDLIRCQALNKWKELEQFKNITYQKI